MSPAAVSVYDLNHAEPSFSSGGVGVSGDIWAVPSADVPPHDLLARRLKKCRTPTMIISQMFSSKKTRKHMS